MIRRNFRVSGTKVVLLLLLEFLTLAFYCNELQIVLGDVVNVEHSHEGSSELVHDHSHETQLYEKTNEQACKAENCEPEASKQNSHQHYRRVHNEHTHDLHDHAHHHHDHTHNHHDHTHNNHHDHSHHQDGHHEHTHHHHEHSHHQDGHSECKHDHSHDDHGHSQNIQHHHDHVHSENIYHHPHRHHNSDHDHSHPPTHGNSQACSHSEELKRSDTTNSKWFDALIGTTFITAGGNMAIIFFMWHDVTESLLRRMVSFAVGGLLGDVFLHLLPHAMEAGHVDHHHNSHDHHDHGHVHGEHDHDHTHSLGIGLAVLGGILTFFFVEKLLRGSGVGSHSHSHSHSHTESGKSSKPSQEQGKEYSVLEEIRPGAILNFAADFVHNFTDGMAIAAAFQVSRSTGMSMTVAVLFHEIPHEVGDFAVLVNQGMTKWQAFGAQFVSAVGAFMGCICGLWFTSAQPTLVLSFTGGGFVYVALANIVPDLLGHNSTISETISQVFMMSLGISFMVVIALYEPHI